MSTIPSILDADGHVPPDRRVRQGDSDLPVWARVLFKYGAITAIALYLIWQNTQGFGATLTSIRDEQRRHIIETNFFLQRVCINTARDDVQRALCAPSPQ